MGFLWSHLIPPLGLLWVFFMLPFFVTFFPFVVLLSLPCWTKYLFYYTSQIDFHLETSLILCFTKVFMLVRKIDIVKTSTLVEHISVLISLLFKLICKTHYFYRSIVGRPSHKIFPHHTVKFSESCTWWLHVGKIVE